MSKIKLIDAVDMSTGVLSRVSHEMECLADSFLDTGNNHVARKLDMWAKDIKEMSRLVREAHSDDIFIQVQQAEESTMNVFRAALAGIEVGQRNKGEG
jgi:hypothetical protein